MPSKPLIHTVSRPSSRPKRRSACFIAAKYGAAFVKGVSTGITAEDANLMKRAAIYHELSGHDRFGRRRHLKSRPVRSPHSLAEAESSFRDQAACNSYKVRLAMEISVCYSLSLTTLHLNMFDCLIVPQASPYAIYKYDHASDVLYTNYNDPFATFHQTHYLSPCPDYTPQVRVSSHPLILNLVILPFIHSSPSLLDCPFIRCVAPHPPALSMSRICLR